MPYCYDYPRAALTVDCVVFGFDETELKCRNIVSQLPDGVYEAESAIDDDGVRKGEPVPIRVKVTIKKGEMTIDLSGCSAERKSGVNSRTLAGARVAYKALTAPMEPKPRLISTSMPRFFQKPSWRAM